MLYAPILVAPRACAVVADQSVSRLLGNGTRQTIMSPNGVLVLLKKPPVNYLALAVIADCRKRLNRFGKSDEIFRLLFAVWRFAYIVCAGAEKDVALALPPSRVEIGIQIHAVNVGFPKRKIRTAVDLEQIFFKLLVSDKARSLLRQPHAVGISHGYEIYTPVKQKLGVLQKVLCLTHHKQTGYMLPRVNAPLNDYAPPLLVSHKDIGRGLPQRAVAYAPRFHAVLFKQLDFFKQILITEHFFNPLAYSFYIV